mmetsp:Transcript_118155/g.176568  ORF Transcript_118155/g.176568 Transcript_118155/m.176568 type:complete len:96 (-) Transcript_118155:1322-1609(-)
MPIKTDDKSLFAAFKDGILLCKLINIAMPGTIDPRAINVNKGDKKINIFKEKENLVLGLKSAGGIGCIMVSITHSHFSEGRAHIILGLLWQILKI